MNFKGIPVNIWDDYYDDGSELPQKTHAYVEDCEIPESTQTKMMAVVYRYLLTLALPGVEMRLADDQIMFCGLTHVRREKLVDELKAAELEFEGQPFRFYSES